VFHAFSFSTVPKNLGRFGIGEFDLEGEPPAKLNLVKEKLNRIGSGHSQRGENSFRLGFDGGGDPGSNGGGF